MGELGLGTWPLGGNAYGHVPKKDAIRVLQRALSLGINTFDTADIYGNGKVESYLGTLATNQKKIRIITKIGYVEENNYAQNFEISFLREQFKKSLIRLKREKLEFLLLHSPPSNILQRSDVRQFLSELKATGLVENVGVSLASVDQYKYLVDWEDIDCIEVIFNMLDQRAIDNGLLRQAATSNWQVIARLPLCSGFLSGKYDLDSRFAVYDRRSRWSPIQLKKWINATKKFDFLVTKERSLVQSALLFCLMTQNVSLVIPGAKTVRQLDELNGVNSRVPQFTEAEYKRIRLIWSDLETVVPK